MVGGASRLLAGMMMAADTEIQRAAGFEDDPADLYQEYMLANQFEARPGLVRRISYEGADALAWLIDLGVKFMPHVMQGGGERVPRSHVPDGGDVPGGHTSWMCCIGAAGSAASRSRWAIGWSVFCSVGMPSWGSPLGARICTRVRS